MKHFIFRTKIATMIMMAISLHATGQATDQTHRIQNPSFETNGLTGWTVNNMATQSHSVFAQKNGTY